MYSGMMLAISNVAGAATLSPKEVQAEFLQWPTVHILNAFEYKVHESVQGRRQSDAKAARHNRRRWRGDLEAFEGRLLHHVEGQ